MSTNPGPQVAEEWRYFVVAVVSKKKRLVKSKWLMRMHQTTLPVNPELAPPEAWEAFAFAMHTKAKNFLSSDPETGYNPKKHDILIEPVEWEFPLYQL